MKNKKWQNPIDEGGNKGSNITPIEPKPAQIKLNEGPFADKEDDPVGAHDSTEQMGEGVATASAVTGGCDFSLIDSPKENPNVGLFTVKNANQAIRDAKNKPVPRCLFGQLWFEGENSILFSDTNTGKTIVAMQIADTISSGKRATVGLAMDAPAQKVAYLDCELSDVQFRKRYSDSNGEDYQFSDNLLRVEINPDAEYPKGYSFEDFLKMSLENLVIEHGVKIIIIDNITFLGNDLEKSNEALSLMKWLKEFRDRHGLSILILAHTPKRDQSKPYTLNDLAGSRKQSVAADSIFAIGVSAKDPKIRYIKELKQRDEEFKYTADNVIVCEIEKPSNFLQFRFLGFGCERDHLIESPKDALIKRAKELKAEGKTQRDIAAELGVCPATVNNYLKK